MLFSPTAFTFAPTFSSLFAWSLWHTHDHTTFWHMCVCVLCTLCRIRQRLSLRGYHAALRAQHMKTLASTLQALRRKPYALDTRANCVRLAGHKRTPKGHKIMKCEASFQEQVRAHNKRRFDCPPSLVYLLL